jgi:hypothetical protein
MLSLGKDLHLHESIQEVRKPVFSNKFKGQSLKRHFWNTGLGPGEGARIKQDRSLSSVEFTSNQERQQ